MTEPWVQARARRLPPNQIAVATAEFTSMELMGIIQRSNSPWSLLHMVPQTNGGSPKRRVSRTQRDHDGG